MSTPFGGGTPGGFSFGQTPTTTQTTTFGSSTPSAATGFGFTGTNLLSKTTQQTPFSFSTPQQTTSAFGFGQPTTTANATPNTFATPSPFGQTMGQSTPFGNTSIFQTPATTATAAPVVGYGITSPQTPAAPSFGGFGTPTTTTATTGFGTGLSSFGGISSTPTTGGITFGATPINPLAGNSLFKTSSVVSMKSVSSDSQLFAGQNIIASTAATATPVGGFNFGTPQSTAPTFGTATGASMFTPTVASAPAVETPAPASSLFAQAFGQTSLIPSVTASAPAPTMNLLGQTQAPTTTTSIFQFGTPTTTTTPGGTAVTSSGVSSFPFGGMKLGSAVTPTVSQPLSNTTASSNLSFGSITPAVVSSAPATTAITGFSLGGLPKTTSTPSTTQSETPPTFNIATTTSAASLASTTGFSLPSLASSVGSTTTSSLGVLSSSVTATAPTVTSSASVVTAGMNFRQLEETINKWTVELEEQEKMYLNQATQVNAWDRMLIRNGEKITQLNDSLERVKLDQEHLEHEIDFILAQQKELEDLLQPLETQMDQTPTLTVQQHADLEREHTYQLAENIDAQMKRMAEDLKEIIDHINVSNNNQDNTDPVYQVGKILNAHMDSLQWIEQNTNLVQRKLEEVSQLYEVRRKDQERRFRLAYD